MRDYEIALKKWAWEKTCKGVRVKKQRGKVDFHGDSMRAYGFNETVDWRDLVVSEYSEDGWEAGSMSESADAGIKVSVRNPPQPPTGMWYASTEYCISTKDELIETLYEILKIEVTDEDRKMV